MNNYRFRLYPENSSVKNLCHSESNDYVISDESDSEIGDTDAHIFSSVHLDSISDIVELRKRLKGMLMLINGALKVIHNFERSQTMFGELSISGSDGVQYSDIVHFKSLDVTQVNPFDFQNPKYKHPSADTLSFLINLSSKDDMVRTVLGMCSLGSDWVNLYRIYETVSQFIFEMVVKKEIKFDGKVDQKDKLISDLFKINANDIKNFKGTTNSFELLGYLSRHGKNNNKKVVAMSRIEASFLVHDVTKKFLEIKLTKANHSIYQI